MEKIGDRIKRLRQEKGITQEELAKIVGLQRGAIAKYENGLVENMKQSTIKLLADYFNVKPSYLLCLDDIVDNLLLIPVLGKVPAGEPILSDENIEGYLPIDPSMYGIDKPDGFFFLVVQGESMNKIVNNGAYVLVRKQDYAEENDVIVAIVNGDEEVTLKRFKNLGNGFIELKPESTYNEFSSRIINVNDTHFKILGKVIGDFKKW